MMTSNYPNEQRNLLQLLSPDVQQMLSDTGAICAGGAITSLFSNRDINDLDIYFPSEAALVVAVSAIYAEDDFWPDTLTVELGSFELAVNKLTQHSIMLKHKDQEVQFMHFRYYPDAKSIFETFDFTACMGAYEFKTGQFILHDDFLRHVSQRFLKFNPNTSFPLVSLMRVEKYKERGYTISKAEMMRLILTCMNLKLTSWDEAKEQIGGMYGYDINQLIDTQVPFSIESLVEQLSNIGELYHNVVPTKPESDTVSFDKVMLHVCDTTDLVEAIDRPLFNEKFLYKCVRSDGTSMYSNKVDYKVGSIIDTADTGQLYFHRDPNNPYTHMLSIYWIECELLSGEVSDTDKSDEKVVVDGKIKVLRSFHYDAKLDGSREMAALREKYTWRTNEFK